MRFHQAVTFLPTLHTLELAKAADDQGYDGIYVSDHMFFPRDRQSRYTYSTAEDGAPGFGDHWDPDTHWPDVVVPDLGHGGGDRACPVHHRRLRGAGTRPHDRGQAGGHGRGPVLGSRRPGRGRRVVRGGVRGHRAGLPHPGQAARRHDPGAARRVGRGAGSSTTARTTTCPPCAWSLRPPGPIPIIGGGHSAPALRRAATLCDGWVAAGAYKPDQARQYLDALAEQRRRAGREDEPFSIYLSLWARPDVDLYRSFEEDYGVTDTLSAPAMVAEVDAVGPSRGAAAGPPRRLGPLRRRGRGQDAMTVSGR